MSTRLKVWLAYPALIVLVLALINFGLFFVNHTAPVSLLISHPLGMLAGGYLGYAFLLPAMFGRLGPKRVLQPTGPVIATGRCGGRIGRVNVSGRLITVTVYSDRLTLRTFLTGEYTIHGQEIRSIADAGSRWRRGVVIEHTAPGQASPVVLASLSDDLRWAIWQIRRDPVAALVEPPVPDTPADKAARNIAWNLTSIMCIGGLVLGIGILIIGVPQLVRTPNLFTVGFTVIGLLSTYQCARELIKHARQD